ncbi:fibronectin type III domain-containing protein [Pelagicoccus albus]|uniref:Fibronectin type III domain-containing protein n=1 Tax=Pelagicoccus albus TaxID=415222 RepID=A0A7X1B5G0_9BACT|nr:fibronectin type III domain-containing protein [Pelagicoccus albus]MBC2605981.1 fibronectin type III domain-containing protein [Pelagicoccus albus]
MRKIALTTLLAGSLVGTAFGAKVSFSLDIEALSDSAGSELSSTGLLVLVVDSNNDGFQSPAAGTIVSGDDQIVTSWDLSQVGPGTTDITLVGGGIDYAADWDEGDPLALIWFPGLSDSNQTPAADEPYGFFTAEESLVSGHSWVMPKEGVLLHSLKLFTASASKLVFAGEVPDSIGKAAYAVGQAIPTVTAPTAITLNATGSTIQVSWTDGSASTGGFLVQRKSSTSDEWVTVGVTESGASSYTDDYNIIPGTTYDYRLLAVSGYSTATGVAQAVEAVRSRIIAFDSRAKMMTGVYKRTIDLSVTGSEDLAVLLQAIGPSLHDSGYVSTDKTIPTDTALDLYYGIQPADADDRLIDGNDDWDLYEDPELIESVMVDYGAYPMYNYPESGDSAFLAMVKEIAGGYTAPVYDPLGSEGVAVVGIYDVNYLEETVPETRLTGVASRSFVGTGFENFRSSVNIVGQVPMTLLIRGQGPWLRDLSETDAFNSEVVLDNPTVTFYKLVSGAWEVVATNDDWGTDNSATVAEIHAASDAVGLPRLTEGSADSAMLLTVEPGIYQAIMDGVDGETGVAQIAIFEVPAE